MAVNTWDGAVSTDWNDAGNWNTTGVTDRVPTSADDVIIPDTSSINNPTLSATGGNPKNVKSLKIEANGTIVGGGIAIRVYGENSNGYAVDNDGIIDGGSTLHLIIKTNTTTALDLNGTSGSFTNVEIDHASCVAQLAENASILGTLTVTLGEFDTASNRDLTVAGDVDITGTLTGNASAISLGSLTINSGGTYSATSATTTITGVYSSPFALNNSGTFTNNDGTLLLNRAGNQDFVGTWDGSSALHNLTIDGNNGTKKFRQNMLIEGDLDVTASDTFTSQANTETLTVNGDVTISGTLGATTQTGAYSFGSLTINSGGTYNATSGTTTITGTGTIINIDGTFTHNNGKVTITGSGDHQTLLPGGATFNNIDVDTTTGHDTKLQEDITIVGTLDLTDSTDYWIVDANGAGANVTMTMGSSTASGTIESAYDSRFRLNPGSSAKCIIQGASTLYPCNVTSNDWYWDYGSGAAGTELANIDFQTDLETHKGGSNTAKITLTGDCEFDAVTISSGDTLDLNGKRIETSGKLDIIGSLTDGGNKSLAVLDNIDTTGTGRNISGASDLILKGSGNVYWSATGGGWNTAFFNGGAYNTWAGSDSFGTTILGAGDLDVLNDTSFGNIQITTGGELDGNTSTLTLSGDWTSSGGLIGLSALAFDASEGYYVDCGTDSSLDLANAITLEAWVKLDGTEAYPRIISKQFLGDNSTSNSCYQLGVRGNKLRFAVGSVFDVYTAGPDIVDDKWHHVVGTYDKTDTKMYLDGKLIYHSTAYTSAIRVNAATEMTLGASSVTGASPVTDYFMEGKMGRASVWSVALTQAQIRDMMFKNFTDATTTNCVAWYQFDEGTSTAVADSTTNNNDGTASSAFWAGAGTFTHGTSTVNLTGTGALTYEGTTNFYILKCAAATKTTTISRLSGGDIHIARNLYVGDGTLARGSSLGWRMSRDSGIGNIDNNGTVVSGASYPVDLSNTYVVYYHDSTIAKEVKWEYFINGTDTTLAANQEATGYWNNAAYQTDAADYNIKCAYMRFSDSANGKFTMGAGDLWMTNAGNGLELTYPSNTFTAGPGATISGSSSATNFKSQNNFSVVGKIENLAVTNEELKVTGQVINCTGDIHQYFPTIDHAQQLDADTADDRDVTLTRDLDKNTELINS